MVLDVFSALSLASNVVQFVDFGFRLISKAQELYHSPSGNSTQNNELLAVTCDFKQLSDRVSVLVLPAATDGKDEDALKKLAAPSKDVADELVSILEDLTAQGVQKRWKSIRGAWKGTWKEDRIQNLAKRMDMLRSQVTSRIVFLLDNKFSSICTSLESIVEENKRMHISRTQDIAKLKDDVLDVIKRHQSCSTTDELSSNLQSLSMKLSILALESTRETKEQKILDSLRFRSMSVRHSKIAEAHSKTFDWIFKESTTDSQPHANFGDWLRNGNGIFWIAGKAGSGKPTLVKYLCDHSRSEALLRSWAGSKRLVTASFFFWNTGTEMQKSQEGLLQSLLFEILRQCPALIQKICAHRWSECSSTKDSDPWTRSELLKTFHQRIVQSMDGAKFCFFIDGLDEYEGDHADIVDLFKGIFDSSCLKVCLSSRPWNVFEEAYGHNQSSKLLLESLTRNDIRLYVRQKLEENRLFIRLKERDARCQDIIDEIVTKARGVFLWVFLVVRSLTHGLTNADRVSDLQKRLRRFPQELEAYFKHMLDRVEGLYQEETAQLFEIALRASEPYSLMAYSFALEEDPEFAIKLFLRGKDWGDHGFSSRFRETTQRINARCQGLLEVYEEQSENGNEFSLYKVDFLHRTVRDFLQTKDLQNMLASRVNPEFDPDVSLCRAFLAQVKSVPTVDRELSAAGPIPCLLRRLIHHAHYIELVHNNTPFEILEELYPTLEFYGNAADFHATFWPSLLPDESSNPFLELCLKRGLYIYLAKKISQDPEVIDEEFGSFIHSYLRNTSSTRAARLSELVNATNRPEEPKLSVDLGPQADSRPRTFGWLWQGWK